MNALMKLFGMVVTGLAATAFAGAAMATPVTFTASGLASSGSPISASAKFDVSGSNLVVTLTNTSTTNTSYDPPDLLAAVFFNISGAPTLSTVSAALTSGSSFVEGSLVGNLGDYWQYKKSATGFSNPGFSTTDMYGISSVGFGIFGGGSGLAGGYFAAGGSSPKINGADYTIVGTDFAAATHNGGITGHGPFEDDSVTFTLAGLPSGFDPLTAISGVTFAYGTAPDSSMIGSSCSGAVSCVVVTTPEPATLAVIGSGLALFGLWRRRPRG
jgi:hypothetical protein